MREVRGVRLRNSRLSIEGRVRQWNCALSVFRSLRSFSLGVGRHRELCPRARYQIAGLRSACKYPKSFVIGDRASMLDYLDGWPRTARIFGGKKHLPREVDDD